MQSCSEKIRFWNINWLRAVQIVQHNHGNKGPIPTPVGGKGVSSDPFNRTSSKVSSVVICKLRPKGAFSQMVLAKGHSKNRCFAVSSPLHLIQFVFCSIPRALKFSPKGWVVFVKSLYVVSRFGAAYSGIAVKLVVAVFCSPTTRPYAYLYYMWSN